MFEHLIIRRFLKETEKAGGNRAFTGKLDGTTSESSVFFTSALFTSESNTLFEKTINDITPFEMSLIQQSISHIEAEMQSNIDIAKTINVTNMNAILKQVKATIILDY